jgi:hypothetical protein
MGTEEVLSARAFDFGNAQAWMNMEAGAQVPDYQGHGAAPQVKSEICNDERST